MQLYSSVAPTTIASQQKTKSQGIGKDTMDQQDFMNLLVEQLKNQDPLNPTDNADFMAQTTAFSQLNEMQTLNTSMNTMLEMMQKQYSTSSNLFNATSFIGKEIEFSTNTVTLGADAVTNLSFYLASTPDPYKSQINIYNEAGELAAIVKPEIGQMVKGSNVIAWDGTGVGGTTVPEGTYFFEVQAYDTDGAKLDVETFTSAVVQGIKESNGVVYFDVGNGSVSSEYIYAVKEPKPATSE